MRLLVTGGTGWFGRALLRHWAAVGDETTAVIVTRDPARMAALHGDLLAAAGTSLVAGDITDADSLPVEGGFTHLIHAATESTAGASLSPLRRFTHAADGTRNVLEAAVRLGIPRVLFTSSGAVYGEPAPGITHLAETALPSADPLLPGSAYAMAKQVGEHLCGLYADEHGLEVVIARCFAFIGEDMPLDGAYAAGNFLRDALAGRPITVDGDGTAVRSYLDQRDLAHWLMALLSRGRAGRAYNVGSDRAVTVGELAHAVDAAAGGAGVRILGGASAGATSRYLPSIARARGELGLDVTVSLPAAIEHALGRLRDPNMAQRS